MKDSKTEKQTLHVHFPKVELILDPHKMEDAFSMAVVGQIFRGLFRFTPKGDIAPDLIESWEESTDHLRYVFRLKKATFSNGAPIAPINVQMSFARMFFAGASMAADLDYVAGATAFKKSGNLSELGIHPLSDWTIEFRLAHPSALFLKHLAVVDSAVLPISDFKAPLDLTARGTYSGPYRVSEGDTTSRLRITKWRKDAMDSTSPPASIEYFMTTDAPMTLAQSERTDTLDRDPVTTADQERLVASGWTVHPTALTGEKFIVLNPKQIPAATRKFLYSKVDPEVLLKRMGPTRFVPAYGVIPAGVPGELSKTEIDHWRTTALEGIRPDPGTVVVEYEDGNPTDLEIVKYLKEVWKAPGLAVEFRPLPKREQLKRMFAKQCQACLGRKGLDYPDGYSVITYFKGKYESNYFHVDDPKIDEAIGQSLRSFDPPERERKYRAIQLEILKHFTVIPLYFGTDASGLWSGKVAMVPPHPMGFHTLSVETVQLRSP